ncbi:MAG: ribbon-helix-helix protein, CopG family [Bdellovibrionota bacterium]
MVKKQASFMRPEEMPPEEKMVPVSARIPESVAAKLNKAAARGGHPVSKLIAHALSAYVEFLEAGKK